MSTIKTNDMELQVAEILLQLQCGLRAPASSSGPELTPPDHNMEDESAATLLLSFAASDTTESTAAQLQPSAINVLDFPKNTREQGTPTDADEGLRDLPDIVQKDCLIVSLYKGIRSLEVQLRVLSASPETPSRDSVTELDPDVSTDLLEIQRLSKNRKAKKRSPSFLNNTNAIAINNDDSDDEWRPEENKSNRKGTDVVPIGQGHAMVPKTVLKEINWNSYTGATRKLLRAVFPRRVLATHSLTGKPSPAFPGKPAKKRLEPALVHDIVQVVAERCGVSEGIVRTSITTKCADESKMYRNRRHNMERNRCHRKYHTNVPPSASDDSSDDE